MKFGTENKKKAVSAALLLLVALAVLYRGVATPVAASRAKRPSAAEQSAAPKASPRSNTRHYIAFLLKPTLDPHLRLDLLAGSEGVRYEGTGRDIFADHSPEDIPKPVAPAVIAKPEPPLPPPPPPPINLKFWGFASQPGEPKAIFLAQGENTFVAHEGDIVARRYKVVKINATSVEIEDVLSSNRQSIAAVY